MKNSEVSQFAYGFQSPDGKVVIPPQFDLVQEFNGELARALKDGKWGLIKKDGSWAMKPKFEFLGKTENGYTLFRTGKLWGVTDAAGKEILPAAYTEIVSVSDKVATVKDNGELVIIDFKGNVIFKGFEKAGKWVSNLAPVLMAKGCGVLKDDGKWLIEPKKVMIYEFSEGLAAFDEKGKSGYFDTTGKVAIAPEFDAAFDFSEGMARVLIGKKAGYINKTGKLVIPANWDDPMKIEFSGNSLEMTSFVNGFAMVAKKVKGILESGFIDTKGNWHDEKPIAGLQLKSFRVETKEWLEKQEKQDSAQDYDKKFEKYREKLEAARIKDEPAAIKVIEKILSIKFEAEMAYLRLVVTDMEDHSLNVYATDAKGKENYDDVKTFKPMKAIHKVAEGGVMSEPKSAKGIEKLNEFLEECAMDNLKWFGKLWKTNGGDKVKFKAYIQNDDTSELYDLNKQKVIPDDALIAS